MSRFYNPQRSRNIFDPKSSKLFKLSRSKVDLFIECPRCFYFDRRKGVGRPPGYPFALNSAVDALLKREFDIYRDKKEAPPLLKENQIDAIPYQHEDLEKWRDSMRHGIQYQFPNTTFLLTGGIDDIWVNPQGEVIIVDYKATSKKSEVTIDADWQAGYRRQMEFYQWLFRKNDFKVYDTGYFVYCNADAGKVMFNKKLEFSIKVIPYKGNDDWVEQTVSNAYSTLLNDSPPEMDKDCDYCRYRAAIEAVASG